MTLRLTAFVTRLRVVNSAFAAVALALIVFALWPPAFNPDLSPPGVGLLNYAYAAMLFAIFASTLATRGIVNLSQSFLLAPLILSLIGVASLAHVWIVNPDITTYSSALIPLLICALPILVSSDDVTIDHDTMLKFILFLLCLASFFHFFWQILEAGGIPVTPGHEQTFVFCFLVLLSGFLRRKTTLALTLLAIGVSLALRPTSTLLGCTMLSLGAILADRLGFRRSLRASMYLTIVLLLLGNLVLMESVSFADAIYSIEPYFKQGVLEAHSNNEFRLGVIEALRMETESSSLVFGKYFSGNVLPYVSNVLPWWYGASGSDYAPVHSDFLIMFSQGGLIGYGLFAVVFLGFAHLCIRGARLATALGNASVRSFFDAALVMEVVFVLYISFNPIMQKSYIVSVFFFLIPVGVLLARDQERAMLTTAKPVNRGAVGALSPEPFQLAISRTFKAIGPD